MNTNQAIALAANASRANDLPSLKTALTALATARGRKVIGKPTPVGTVIDRATYDELKMQAAERGESIEDFIGALLERRSTTQGHWQ